MTRAEWDALSAREKDAIVAEKVMGWTRPTREFQPWDMDPEAHPGCCLCTPHDLPRYTSSWDAMREVVEKMREMWAGRLAAKIIADPDGWSCDFVALTGHGLIGRAQNKDTAPEAVAVAALRALGHIHD